MHVSRETIRAVVSKYLFNYSLLNSFVHVIEVESYGNRGALLCLSSPQIGQLNSIPFGVILQEPTHLCSSLFLEQCERLMACSISLSVFISVALLVSLPGVINRI